ncbi:MAG: hypothetical protein AAGF48_15525 [Pseudomonadota bacterium]
MHKYLITPKSHNRILGPIMVTTSPRRTCPLACPLRKTGSSGKAGACYAEHGFLGGFIWTKLDALQVGQSFKAGRVRVYAFEELLAAIRALPEGTLWRHNQAGDLASDDQETIDAKNLAAIVAANKGRRGFTYTHYDVERNAANREAVQLANQGGFRVNLSADTLEQADRLAELAIAPVTVVVPATVQQSHRTPAGRKVIICPARQSSKMTCARCGICAKNRKAIVAFPALGRGASKIDADKAISSRDDAAESPGRQRVSIAA